MRSDTPTSPIRRPARLAQRRTRRRPAVVAAGLSVGILTAAAFTVATPVSQADASSAAPTFVLASFSSSVKTAASAASAGTVDLSFGFESGVQDARTAAAATHAAATAVTTDIAASGLDIAVPDTSIDTAELDIAVQRLESVGVVPPPLVPYLTEKVTAQVASVDARVASLRGSLDAAKALKAEQEAAAAAAAQAQAEADARAAAALSATAKKSSGTAPVYATGGGTGDNSPAGAQASARGMLGGYGWGDDQFGCLVSLWNRESGWNYQASNRSSGAYGIPQALPGSKMSSAGADWQSNAATQVAWGLGYISGRYGSPCSAWAHSESTGWY